MKKIFKQRLAYSVALMMAATFTACSDKDTPVEHKPILGGDVTLVTNDAELRSAISKGTSVQLANDIDLGGRKLGGKPSRAGVYIYNGKKVMK